MSEERLVNILRNRKETISTMESCTAGYIATTITNVDNSSEVLKYGLNGKLKAQQSQLIRFLDSIGVKNTKERRKL